MKIKSTKQVKLKRAIKPPVERELWGRAAARCEFSDCNRLLYKSPVTQEAGNFAEMAHIYSFSAKGTRGHGPHAKNPAALNEVDNLLLVCHDCHLKIDADKKEERYPASLLQMWKAEHETRVRNATDFTATKKSHVILYGARIGEENSPLCRSMAFEAMFPEWFPADDRAVNLSMQSALDDSTPEFWTTEAAHLRKEFDRHLRVRIDEAEPNHFSLFPLAPQPLLILLGSLLTDKVPAVVYQPHREPTNWAWQPHPDEFDFTVIEPRDKSGTPVLVFSLSAKISRERVEAVLSPNLSIWEITIDEPHNDFLQSELQLSKFRAAARKTIGRIQKEHGKSASTLAVFPAMPVACAVEFGRIRMPKADLPWVIYDQNHRHNKFIKTIAIGNHHE